MKTIIKPIIILSIIVVGFMSLLENCKKDTDCIAVITVRKHNLITGDTNLVIPNAHVKLSQGDVKDSGLTDINGQFRYTFKLPAILNVKAVLFKKDSSSVDSLKGVSVIQLVVGGTAQKTVFVE